MGVVDLMILEAFPSYTPEQVDALSQDVWFIRAVQAEYALSEFRGIQVQSVDILLGVPEEVVAAKRMAAIQALREAQAKALAQKRGAKPGEKGPVDPQQQKEFLEEYERTKVETAFGGGMGIPEGMLPEVDFSLPDTMLGK